MFARFQGARAQLSRTTSELRTFLTNESGAATVDWASATVVAAGIGISTLSTMQGGASEVAQDFRGQMSVKSITLVGDDGTTDGDGNGDGGGGGGGSEGGGDGGGVYGGD